MQFILVCEVQANKFNSHKNYLSKITHRFKLSFLNKNVSFVGNYLSSKLSI